MPVITIAAQQHTAGGLSQWNKARKKILKTLDIPVDCNWLYTNFKNNLQTKYPK